MARIFLHIGTHKTGTTSIQYYLNYRKDELLAQGILAPGAGKTSDSEYSGNHRLAWSVDFRKGETTTECWDHLDEIMKTVAHEKVVLSSEAFCLLNLENVGRVKELLKGHEVIIIIYFRNYKAFLRARYAQVIRDRKEIRSFPGYVSSSEDWTDYDKILRNWGEHFGYDHLIVRVYDEVISKGNLISDFCRIIGFIPPENDRYFQLQRNTSPDEQTIKIMRLVNICKTRLPFLIKDQTFRDLKEAYFNNVAKYTRQKWFLKFFVRNHSYSKSSEKLITQLNKNKNQQILKKMIGQKSMDFLEK